MVTVVWAVPFNYWDLPATCWIHPVGMVDVPTLDVGRFIAHQLEAHVSKESCQSVFGFLQGADVHVTSY